MKISILLIVAAVLIGGTLFSGPAASGDPAHEKAVFYVR
jgi:hypothetical protein